MPVPVPGPASGVHLLRVCISTCLCVTADTQEVQSDDPTVADTTTRLSNPLLVAAALLLACVGVSWARRMSWQERIASARAHREALAAGAATKEVAGNGWTATLEMLSGDVQRATIQDDQGRPLKFEDVVSLWERDGLFSEFFVSVLRASSFDTFFFECPPVTRATIRRDYEHVTVRAHRFRSASASDFQSHFDGCAMGAVTFANLGGDAQLVAPCPRSADHHQYGHIAAFTRGAAMPQQVELWKLTGLTMRQTLERRSAARTWLNTEGSGVPWLHVRMDSTPKYYHHMAYARDGD